MNLFNTKVLENLNLSEDEVMEIQLNSKYFYPKSDILRIYRLNSYDDKDERQVLVNLNDIIGYETDYNLAQAMDSLFDSWGDEYHSRSISLFDLTIDNFREKLFPELTNGKNKDPFKIREKRRWKI